METLPTIQAERLVLRQPRSEDLKDLVQYAGEREIHEGTLNIPYPYTDQNGQEYLARAMDSMLHDKEYIFIISDKTTNKFMGTFVLKIDIANYKAEIGYWLGKPFWGNNFTTEAVKTMLRFGFMTLGLNRLEAHHLLFNSASGRVLEKCGFCSEGKLKSEILHDGFYHDMVLYGLLKKDFLKLE